MKKKNMKKIILSALFLSFGLILPFFTGQIQVIGKALLPMHIPVLLCGFVCGAPWGLMVGLLLPLMRSLLFGMPVLYPTALAMTAELAAYGFISGWLYSRSRWQCVKALYRCLLLAMLAGRVLWGGAMVVLMGLGGSIFTWRAFIGGAVLNAIPGIVLQLLLIPVVMLLLDRTHLVPFVHQGNTMPA